MIFGTKINFNHPSIPNMLIRSPYVPIYAFKLFEFLLKLREYNNIFDDIITIEDCSTFMNGCILIFINCYFEVKSKKKPRNK